MAVLRAGPERAFGGVVSFDDDDASINRGEPPAASIRDQLRISVCTKGKTVIWKLEGEVDLASIPLLHETYEGMNFDNATVLELDMSGLTFFDSSGLAFLIFLHNEFAAHGASTRLVIRKPTQEIRRVFEITGLASVFKIEPSTSSDLD